MGNFKKIAVLILMVMTLSLTACGKVDSPEKADSSVASLENGVYTNTELGMTVSLPEGWESNSTEGGEFYFSSDDTYISLTRWDSSNSAREEESAQEYIKNQVDLGYEAIDNIVVGNAEFYAAEYSGTYEHQETGEDMREGVCCVIIAEADVDDHYYELEINCSVEDYSSGEEAIAAAQDAVKQALESIQATE